MIHRQSFYLGYDKAIEEVNRYIGSEGIVNNQVMTNEQAYNVVKATVVDTLALTGVVEHISNHWYIRFETDGTITITDKFERRWLLEPIKNPDIHLPFIIIPLGKEV